MKKSGKTMKMGINKMTAQELRLGNFVYHSNEHIFPVQGVSDGWVSLMDEEVQDNKITPVKLTAEWLLKFGFDQQLVCETCSKISGSKYCHKGHPMNIGDFQFLEQAIKNGLYSDCKEPKSARGEFNLNGFYIFKGKTIQSWSKEGSWNFGQNAWNLNLTVTYVHQLQNLYFALTGTELLLNQNDVPDL